MKSFAIVSCTALVATAAVQAGDMSASAPKGATSAAITAGTLPGVGGMLDEIGGSLSVGYDTDYYFRGAHLGDQPIWAGADISVPVTGDVAVDLGAWYINPTGTGVANDELDLYASTGVSLGDLEADLGVTHYRYLEAGDDADANTTELSLGFDYSLLDMIDLGIGLFYDLDLETFYGEASTGTSYEVADGIDVALGATFGYLLDEGDTGGDSDWNHILLVASLPIALTETAALEPYIAYNVQGDRFDQGGGDADDDLFGGVSLNVSF